MATKKGELTPMMKQFYDLKSKHPGALMLFRCGDFYETYCEDAVEAARILGITLTRRNNGASQGDEMAGFPHHALDTYLPKLVRAGKRVAICDQLEDPKLAKKLVKRGITELVTPGVAMSDNVLNYKENNFLAAIHFGKASCGVAFLDISTGEFLVGQGEFQNIEKLLGNFAPKEILINRDKKKDFYRYFGTKLLTYEMDDWVFTEQTALQRLHKHFNVKNLKGFGIDHLHDGIVSAGVILQYLEITQHTQIGHITSISRIEEERFVRLDKFTIRSLELAQTMQEDGVSLIDVIDRTVSPMGARLLRRWVHFPLRDKRTITMRHDKVDYFFRHPDFRHTIDNNLQQVGDLERLVGKVATNRISPREVVALGRALAALVPMRQACLESDSEPIQQIGQQINLCTELQQRIERELKPESPQLIAKGDFIREGVSEQLDDLRRIAYSGKDYLLELQQREAERTGISSLKIGFNNVFGYYLEVRNTFKDNVPAEWVRKQTLAQAERYITQELKEYEEKILGAEQKIQALETQLFDALVFYMQQYISAMQHDAALLAEIDCLLSFAKTAEEHHYIRPQLTEEDILDIHQGRHPVIETQLPVGETYVPNDVLLNNKDQQIIIITGPNMAGKSALLRQTALIVLMAQIGCFVPAESATIGLVDKIFTRVGASDNISLGESTFMVEMTEAANILNSVTPHSLVLFDELGRGTSTYDGISIAWAIVEHLHQNPRAQARTLFATHYHELNEMEKQFERIRNYNVSVKEVGGKVIFLRRLERGGSEHSFGIHVAEIAGMPRTIVKRANDIMHNLENGSHSPKPKAEGSEGGIPAGGNANTQLSFFQLDDPVLCQIRDAIKELDIDNLTPMQALNKLHDIKRIL